jgi:hypothetical protein
MAYFKFPLPSYLQGTTTSQATYNKWLVRKSNTLHANDLLRKRPYALNGSAHLYAQLINDSVIANGLTDPFTGDRLHWDQILTWDDTKDKGHNNIVREFFLLPTVDHKYPYGETLEFEICSWLINSCKNDQTPEEFIAMCRMVWDFRSGAPPTGVGGPKNILLLKEQKETMATPRSRRRIHPPIKSGAFCVVGKYPTAKNNATPGPFSHNPKRYFLPDFLIAICTEAAYLKWLDSHAENLYRRDLKQGRPYAMNGSKVFYKRAIHAAALACGLYDPFTGERMKWESIGTWDPIKIKYQPDGFKKFYLLPTVDHIDPYANDLQFEICTWRINSCKVGLTPDEFGDVCRRVTERN